MERIDFKDFVEVHGGINVAMRRHFQYEKPLKVWDNGCQGSAFEKKS